MRLNRGVSGGLTQGRRAGSLALWRLGAACLLVAGACAPSRRVATAPPQEKVVDLSGEAPTDGPTTLLVDNQNMNDMTIYLYQSGQRMRLGRARANGQTSLRIPKSLVSGLTQVRFQAQPLGNQRGFTSELLSVTPGDVVEFYVPHF